MLPRRSAAAPVVDDAGVTFSLADPTGRLRAVRLEQELGVRTNLDFTRKAGVWTLRLPNPDVDRMEYLLEIVDYNDFHATIADPRNPLKVAGAFGDKSVVLFPGYREPSWLALPDVPASTQPLRIETLAQEGEITGELWSPQSLAPDEPAPLLVVHDGPEYATLGSLTHYLSALIATGTLPVLRAALLAPGDRNSWYSAHAAYAQALCTEVVPALDRLGPATLRIGVGVSLGALAMLHAQRSYPATFDGLLLQSGSFFTPDLDPQEADFPGFAPVTEFVAGLTAADGGGRPVPTTLTCGTSEENLANNRSMAATLTRLGYRVGFHAVRDTHNYTGWRDALDPACTTLLTSLVGAHAA